MKALLVDRLRIESSSAHVAYAEFITSYKKFSKSLYCFFEGKEDKRYYSIRIEQTTLKNIKCFTCNGKDKVIDTFRLINLRKEYTDAKTLYFIDKDYDFSKFNIDKIYRTPYYSIENFYCGQKTLEKVLESEFEISNTKSDFKRILKLFKKLQTKFQKDVLFLNSWLACQYDIQKKSKNKSYLFIDNALEKYLKNIVSADLSGIVDLSNLKNQKFIEEVLFPNAQKIQKQRLKRKIKRLKKLEPYKYFRGKFEIRFIISFLFRLQAEIGKKKSNIFKSKYSCSLRFEKSSCISLLSQYAETPSSLFRYLGNFKKAN